MSQNDSSIEIIIIYEALAVLFLVLEGLSKKASLSLLPQARLNRAWSSLLQWKVSLPTQTIV